MNWNATAYSGRGTVPRVLLAVQSESDRVEIHRILRGAGQRWKPEHVASAAQLRAVLADKDACLLICDNHSDAVQLPEALAILWESGQDVPCIALVDKNNTDVPSSVMRGGVRDYITTQDMSRLLAVIERESQDREYRCSCLEAIGTLRDSEQRLRLALAASHTGIWEWDPRTNRVNWSPECQKVLNGIHPVGDLDGFLEVVHPDDAQGLIDASQEALHTGKSFSREFRIILKSGEVRWVAMVGQAKYDEQGRPLLLVGTVQDITEQKDAKERLQEAHLEMERYSSYYEAILERLHAVREQERARLSREIHDELGQALTSLKLTAHAITRLLEHGDTTGGILKVHSFVNGIDLLIQTVRDIASELRPPLLDQLGLAAALEWQCNVLRKQHGFEVSLKMPAKEPALSDTQRIILFRIAQESLTNVMRHSGTQAARLCLEDGKDVCLTISDDGGGINESQVTTSLGILGMRDRARLIGAEFAIEGAPGHGTTVRVRIPSDRLKGARGEEKSAAGR